MALKVDVLVQYLFGRVFVQNLSVFKNNYILYMYMSYSCEYYVLY